jgi:hypothetical protein
MDTVGTVTATSGDLAYKIVNPNTRRVIRDWTTISNPGTTTTITVALADNTIQEQGSGTRHRKLFIRDASNNILGQYDWAVEDTAMDA